MYNDKTVTLIHGHLVSESLDPELECFGAYAQTFKDHLRVDNFSDIVLVVGINDIKKDLKEIGDYFIPFSILKNAISVMGNHGYISYGELQLENGLVSAVTHKDSDGIVLHFVSVKSL